MRQSFNPIVRDIMEELQGANVQHQSAAMPTPGQEQVPGQVKKPGVKLKPSAALASKAAGSIQAIADKAAQDAAAGVQDDMAQQQGVDPEQQKQINTTLKAQPKPTRATSTAASRGIQGDALSNRAAGLGGKPVQATEGEAEEEWEVSYYPMNSDKLKVVRGFPSEVAAEKYAKAEGLSGPKGTADDLSIHLSAKKTNEAKDDESKEGKKQSNARFQAAVFALNRAHAAFADARSGSRQRLRDAEKEYRAALASIEKAKTNEEVAGEAGGAAPPLPKDAEDVLTNPDAEEDYNEKEDEPRASQRAKEIFPGAKPNTAAGYGKDGAGRCQHHTEVTNPRQTTAKKTDEKEPEKTEEAVFTDQERTQLLDEVFSK